MAMKILNNKKKLKTIMLGENSQCSQNSVVNNKMMVVVDHHNHHNHPPILSSSNSSTSSGSMVNKCSTRQGLPSRTTTPPNTTRLSTFAHFLYVLSLYRYVLLCLLFGCMSLIIGVALFLLAILFRSNTTSLHLLESVPLYLPGLILFFNGISLVAFMSKNTRSYRLMKTVCGLYSLVALLMIIVAWSTSTIHLPRLHSHRECAYNVRIRACTCTVLQSTTVDNNINNNHEISNSDDPSSKSISTFNPIIAPSKHFIMEEIMNCDLVHGIIHDSLRVVFALSLLAIVVSMFSIWILYQLYNHEKEKEQFLQQKSQMTQTYHNQQIMITQHNHGQQQPSTMCSILSSSSLNNGHNHPRSSSEDHQQIPQLDCSGSQDLLLHNQHNHPQQSSSSSLHQNIGIKCLSADFSSQDLLLDHLQSSSANTFKPSTQHQDYICTQSPLEEIVDHLESTSKIWSSQSTTNFISMPETMDSLPNHHLDPSLDHLSTPSPNDLTHSHNHQLDDRINDRRLRLRGQRIIGGSQDHKSSSSSTNLRRFKSLIMDTSNNVLQPLYLWKRFKNSFQNKSDDNGQNPSSKLQQMDGVQHNHSIIQMPPPHVSIPRFSMTKQVSNLMSEHQKKQKSSKVNLQSSSSSNSTTSSTNTISKQNVKDNTAKDSSATSFTTSSKKINRKSSSIQKQTTIEIEATTDDISSNEDHSADLEVEAIINNAAGMVHVTTETEDDDDDDDEEDYPNPNLLLGVAEQERTDFTSNYNVEPELVGDMMNHNDNMMVEENANIPQVDSNHIRRWIFESEFNTFAKHGSTFECMDEDDLDDMAFYQHNHQTNHHVLHHSFDGILHKQSGPKTDQNHHQDSQLFLSYFNPFDSKPQQQSTEEILSSKNTSQNDDLNNNNHHPHQQSLVMDFVTSFVHHHRSSNPSTVTTAFEEAFKNYYDSQNRISNNQNNYYTLPLNKTTNSNGKESSGTNRHHHHHHGHHRNNRHRGHRAESNRHRTSNNNNNRSSSQSNLTANHNNYRSAIILKKKSSLPAENEDHGHEITLLPLLEPPKDYQTNNEEQLPNNNDDDDDKQDNCQTPINSGLCDDNDNNNNIVNDDKVSEPEEEEENLPIRPDLPLELIVGSKPLQTGQFPTKLQPMPAATSADNHRTQMLQQPYHYWLEQLQKTTATTIPQNDQRILANAVDFVADVPPTNQTNSNTLNGNDFILDDDDEDEDDDEEDDDGEDEEEHEDGAGDTSTSQDIADFELELDEEPIKFISEEDFKRNAGSLVSTLFGQSQTILFDSAMNPTKNEDLSNNNGKDRKQNDNNNNQQQNTIITKLPNTTPTTVLENLKTTIKQSVIDVQQLQPATTKTNKTAMNLLEINMNQIIKQQHSSETVADDYGFDGFRKGCFDDDSSVTTSDDDESSSLTNNATTDNVNEESTEEEHSITAEYIKPPTPFTTNYIV